MKSTKAKPKRRTLRSGPTDRVLISVSEVRKDINRFGREFYSRYGKIMSQLSHE